MTVLNSKIKPESNYTLGASVGKVAIALEVKRRISHQMCFIIIIIIISLRIRVIANKGSLIFVRLYLKVLIYSIEYHCIFVLFDVTRGRDSAIPFN